MRSPKDLQAHASKYLRNHFAEALADPDSVRVDWPLHPPTAAAAARDIDATQGFIRAWQRWPHQEDVIYESRNWSRAGLGTNNIPARITINGAERIATPRALTSSTPAPVNEHTASLPSFPIPPTSPTPSAAAIPNGRI